MIILIRAAINGFGRIGRYLIRAAADNPDIDIVAINSRSKDTKLLAHMLRFDSIHGTFRIPVSYDADNLYVDGKKIRVVSETTEIARLPWKELDIDVVFESTGEFRDKKSNEGHIEAGAKIVIIAAPGKKIDGTFVMGVNEHTFDAKKHKIISNASCTTNCLAPIVKLLHDRYGVEDGMMTTIHSYTMDQRILDGSHTDLRRSRAGAMSIIPTTTGAAKAIGDVIPELKGKLDGLAIRVPTPNVSMVDLVVTLKSPATKEDVNALMVDASKTVLKDILACSDDELVSIDFVSDPHSAIVDLSLTSMMGNHRLKILAWYDNEAGYAHRMIDLGIYVGKKIAQHAALTDVAQSVAKQEEQKIRVDCY